MSAKKAIRFILVCFQPNFVADSDAFTWMYVMSSWEGDNGILNLNFKQRYITKTGMFQLGYFSRSKNRLIALSNRFQVDQRRTIFTSRWSFDFFRGFATANHNRSRYPCTVTERKQYGSYSALPNKCPFSLKIGTKAILTEKWTVVSTQLIVAIAYNSIFCRLFCPLLKRPWKLY